MIRKSNYLPTLIILTVLLPGITNAQEQRFSGWETNLSQKNIALDELRSGGPGKDGIPSIDNPKFIIPDRLNWIQDNEPVVALSINGKAKAYPLQILIWHEIVNDEIGGQPVMVTFCPLCYSAIVFDRTVNGDVLEFGVSGFLRNSNLVMYDRETESLWQQISGQALVGNYAGRQLKQLPGQIISFKQFKATYPQGMVLSRKTGYQRNYGHNPYQGYDDINNTPMMLPADKQDPRLRPMRKVVGIKVEGKTKAYPYNITSEKQVIHDTVGNTRVVIFHVGGAASALDKASIPQSKEAGSTGAFKSMAHGKKLTFHYRDGKIYDDQTGSVWNVSGQSIEGSLKGTQLTPIESGDYFAFAWLVFYPKTTVFGQ